MREKHFTPDEWCQFGLEITAMPSQIKICNHVSGMNPMEAEANANLVSASLDLLYALEHILMNSPTPTGGAKLMAERAIAKAYGEKP